MPTPLEQLHVDPRWVEVIVSRELHWVHSPILDSNYETSLWMHLRSAYQLMTGLYLQGRAIESASHKPLLFRFANEYFCGSWRRNHADEGVRRGGGLWVDEIRAVLGFGAASCAWDELQVICNAIDPSTKDVSTLARHKRWIGLLVHLAARREGDGISYCEQIQADSKATRVEKAAASCVLSLLRPDGTFMSTLRALVVEFERSLFRRPELACKVCFEGTYLYHEAARRGLVSTRSPSWPGIMPPFAD